MMDNEEGDGIIYSINKEQISTLVQVQITFLASKPFFQNFRDKSQICWLLRREKNTETATLLYLNLHECVCLKISKALKVNIVPIFSQRLIDPLVFMCSLFIVKGVCVRAVCEI